MSTRPSAPRASSRLQHVLAVGAQCCPRGAAPVGIPVPDPERGVDVRDDNCAICLEPLRAPGPDAPGPDAAGEIEALKCVPPFFSHQFHLACVLEYYDVLKQNYEPFQCPICRTDMTAGETDRFDALLAPAPPTPPAAAPLRRPVRQKAFVYVLVRNLGFGGNTNQSGPHLLLMGHKKRIDRRHWGVPGGLMDRSDPDSMYTAVREFLEEMGVNQSPSPQDVFDAQTVMLRRGRGGLQEVVPTNNAGFSAFAVVFDTAVQFETEMGITRMLRRKGAWPPDIKVKYDLDLSRETKGFTYIPVNALPGTVLPSFPVRPPQGPPYRAVRAGPGLRVTQLKLRRGISERALRGAARML